MHAMLRRRVGGGRDERARHVPLRRRRQIRRRVGGGAPSSYGHGVFLGTFPIRRPPPEQDRPHGRGTLRSADGNVYEGDFRDGKKAGRGTYTYAMLWLCLPVCYGYAYAYAYAMLCYAYAMLCLCYAMRRWADGGVHEGEGRSIAVCHAMLCYAMLCCAMLGEWRADKREGHGVSRFAAGTVYEGEYT